jgi:hypothetical protein
VKPARAGFGETVVLQDFVCAGEKTYWAANEVVVNYAMPYTIDFAFTRQSSHGCNKQW